MKRMETERQVIERVAREYRDSGMTVVVRPTGSAVPSFLEGFEPDAIAFGSEENVVIEVKSSPSLHTSTDIVALAARVQTQPGWRFELVVQPVRDDPALREQRRERKYQVLSTAEIEQRLATARHLRQRSDQESSLIIAWVAVEATLRRLALLADLDIERSARGYLLKTLVVQGAISRSDYQQLERSLLVRNRVAHGHPAEVQLPKMIDSLLVLCERLLDDLHSKFAHGKSPANESLQLTKPRKAPKTSKSPTPRLRS